MNGIIDLIAQRAEDSAAETSDTEYIGPDGLLRCKICGGPRETIIQPPFELAKPRKVRCWCHCPTPSDLLEAEKKRVEIAQNISVCFDGTQELKTWTFERDDGKAPELTAGARKYAAEFKQHLKDGMGLMYYGPVGTGKTYLAACIANEVLAQGYRVRMTNFAQVADEIWSAPNKAAYIADLCKYALLILDDLGAERRSDYMTEMVYKIVNARYTAGRPVIVTTNLTTDELSKTKDTGFKRTYDRLLERCLPVKVDGRSRRRAAAAQNWETMRRELHRGGETNG